MANIFYRVWDLVTILQLKVRMSNLSRWYHFLVYREHYGMVSRIFVASMIPQQGFYDVRCTPSEIQQWISWIVQYSTTILSDVLQQMDKWLFM